MKATKITDIKKALKYLMAQDGNNLTNLQISKAIDYLSLVLVKDAPAVESLLTNGRKLWSKREDQ